MNLTKDIKFTVVSLLLVIFAASSAVWADCGNCTSSKKHNSKSQADYKLSPEGWVNIAVDYDNDGRFDSSETIYYYDLEKARDMSAGRKGRQEGSSYRSSQQRDGMNYRSRSQQLRQKDGRMSAQKTITGDITELRDMQMTDEKFRFARVESKDGEKTAKVCLGPKSNLYKLKLNEGDRITVKGRPGRINDKTMLMAEEVTAGDKKVSIDLPDSRKLKRARGEIISMREAKFKGFDEKHVVAKVELVSGKEETVNLGPVSKVDKLELEEGDDVSILARPGKVNGRPAMIAEQIEANKKVVKLPRPEDTKKFKK
jgi:hypothetical protein